MTWGQRLAYFVFTAIWLGASGYYWAWWMGTRGNAANKILFTIVSLAWFYASTLLPTFYLFFVGYMRRPGPASAEDAVRAGVIGKVAVISLTVPGSESLDIVRRQLVAMKAIRYPHESWILVDKLHSAEIQQLAREMGVYYFCRHDARAWGRKSSGNWNAEGPPYQEKTKAGNVNAWLDAYGSRYSHFTQLDIDHVPASSYLDRVLGYFRDQKVAWVQAPSVYGNHQYWTARGSSEQEVVLQGPLQMGFFGFCRTPFIIGSHCTYDTGAVRKIGGFQPTRAEDHLDTVVLAAQGREGVYVPEIIAVGDGPETFETYLAQQFAWAYSMIQVLFHYTPKLIRRYTARQALQFLFAQTWYTFWSLSMLTLFFAPLVSLFLNEPVSHVSLLQFFVHSIPAGVTALGVWYWTRRWHQPQHISLSWRGIVLQIARWQVVLSAFVQVLLRIKKPYMITVKGMSDDAARPLRLRVLAPYLTLIVASLGACWFYIGRYDRGPTQGYLFFGLENAAMFLVVLFVILAQDAVALRRLGVSLGRYLTMRVTALLLATACAGLLAATTIMSYSRLAQTLARSPW